MARTPQSGTSEPNVFYPEDYGAVRDGIADDRTAIQNAIDACYSAGGGTVYLRAGNYLANPLSSGLCIQLKTGVKLKGAGKTITTISSNNSTAVVPYNIISPYGYNTATSPYSAHELEIEDMTVTGTDFSNSTATNYLHNIIAVAHCPRARILRVGFGISRAHYIEFNRSKNALVEDCSTEGAGNCGTTKFQLDPAGQAGQVSTNAEITTTISNSASYASGTQVLLTVASTANMKVNDLILITGANGTGASVYNALCGYRITDVVSSTTVAIDLTWASVSSAATTAGTIKVRIPVENITISRYIDKEATTRSEDKLRDFMDLSHQDFAGIFRNVTVKDCLIVPYTCTGTVAAGNTRSILGFDNGAYPIEFDGLYIQNNRFTGGGHTGNTILINIVLPYSASYPKRYMDNVVISGNMSDGCGYYSAVYAGDASADSTVRTSIATTAIQTNKSIVIENNNFQPILRGGATTYNRPSRIIFIGSANKASLRNNRIYFPNVAPSNLNGLSWTASTSNNYGVFIDHVRDLICEGNEIEVALTENNALLYLHAFVFGCSAFELAASGPISASQVWRNNSAVGTGSIGSGIVRGFTELLTAGTTGVSSWSSSVNPSVKGVWEGNRFSSGGTPSVDTCAGRFTLNIPINGTLTTAITDSSEAEDPNGTNPGRHRWGYVPRFATATLVGGTVTVTDNQITANSMIKVTRTVNGGTIGEYTVTRTVGTSYTITSSSALDTSTLMMEITEPR